MSAEIPISAEARALCATMTGEGDALCLAKPCDWCLLIQSALTAAREQGAAEARAEAACHVASYRQIADPKLVADRIKRGKL